MIESYFFSTFSLFHSVMLWKTESNNPKLKRAFQSEILFDSKNEQPSKTKAGAGIFFSKRENAVRISESSLFNFLSSFHRISQWFSDIWIRFLYEEFNLLRRVIWKCNSISIVITSRSSDKLHLGDVNAVSFTLRAIAWVSQSTGLEEEHYSLKMVRCNDKSVVFGVMGTVFKILSNQAIQSNVFSFLILNNYFINYWFWYQWKENLHKYLNYNNKKILQ